MKKTTMSVREMGASLGLKKVESYWLVHKKWFETITVNGRMRVVIESFERWYNNQYHYQKVDGPPPEMDCMTVSYMGRLLGVSSSTAYDLANRGLFKTFSDDKGKRVVRSSFDAWLASQNRYRIHGGPPPRAKHIATGYEGKTSQSEMAALQERFAQVQEERMKGG